MFFSLFPMVSARQFEIAANAAFTAFRASSECPRTVGAFPFPLLALCMMPLRAPGNRCRSSARAIPLKFDRQGI
jgi:hypothetical protein